MCGPNAAVTLGKPCIVVVAVGCEKILVVTNLPLVESSWPPTVQHKQVSLNTEESSLGRASEQHKKKLISCVTTSVRVIKRLYYTSGMEPCTSCKQVYAKTARNHHSSVN